MSPVDPRASLPLASSPASSLSGTLLKCSTPTATSVLSFLLSYALGARSESGCWCTAPSSGRTSSTLVLFADWTSTKASPTCSLQAQPTAKSVFQHRLTLGAFANASRTQIWVWDLNTPQKPYSPGTRSRNLADITSLAWNHQVSHILASSSTSGYTVVWDLKGRREVVALNYAAPQAMNQGQPWMGGPQQPRAGLSAVSWHPENASTATALSPSAAKTPLLTNHVYRPPNLQQLQRTISTLWSWSGICATLELLKRFVSFKSIWMDMTFSSQAHTRAYHLQVLSGHEKGILSMNWCAEDPDLLVSSGKDSRTILWNPNTGESVGEVRRSSILTKAFTHKFFFYKYPALENDQLDL